MERKVLGIDLEKHVYKDEWGIAFFKYTEKGTPILIEFYSDNSFCTDFIAYAGTFEQIETISTIDIVHSMHNYIKYRYIDHKMSISQYDKKCVPLYCASFTLKKFDIYTGENAQKRIEFYKNLN